MAKRSINVTDESNGVFKTIFLLAWPVFLEQIFTTLVGYADTAMVGSMGAAATAAVSISQPPIMLLNGIVMSLGVGITTLVARAAGAGDTEQVKKLMRHAVMLIVFLGLPVSALTIALHRMSGQSVGRAWGTALDKMKAPAIALITAVALVSCAGSWLICGLFELNAWAALFVNAAVSFAVPKLTA